MAVIAFPNLSPQGPEASMSWELRSLTAINRSPLNAVATTLERPGAHWAVRMPYQNLAEDRRARLQTFVSSARGHAQRFYVPVYGWTRRGSFPASELLTNNYFASGTTGWAAASATIDFSVSDGLARVRRNAFANTRDLLTTSGAATVTQYAPYAARALILHGSGAWNSGPQIGSVSGGADYGSTSSTSSGLRTVAAVIPATSAWFGLADAQGSPNSAGEFAECAYTSLARCALVDNGANSLLRSDTFDNATWTKTNATITADIVAAPDGAGTADALVDDGTNGVHQVTQDFTVAAAAADIAIVAYAKANSRNFGYVGMDEGGSTSAVAWFNLNTGVVGTVTVGAGWSSGRSFIASLGDGWYMIALVARKTTSATTITARVGAADVDANTSYAGSTNTAMYLGRAAAALSSVPMRPVATTTTAVASGTSQTGSALCLKGLPASTNGLLLQGDPVEIVTGSTSQLVRTRAPLNSDAAGLGYFEFEPPLRVSPSDNAAVIIHNPMCRMMMESNVNGWTDRIGGFADLEFAAVEDVSP